MKLLLCVSPWETRGTSESGFEGEEIAGWAPTIAPPAPHEAFVCACRLSDQREDLLAQDLDQPGLANGDALMREKNLQPLASGNGRTLRLGNRRRARALEKAKQPHAALRMNSVLKKLFRSLGTLMVTVSPLRRRAAS